MDAYDWLKLVFWWVVSIGICFRFTRLNDSHPKIGKLLLTAAWIGFASWLAFGGISKIHHAWHHHGPGMLFDDNQGKMTPEAQYKRHHYVNGALSVGFGVLLIIAVIYYRTPSQQPPPPKPPGVSNN